MENSILTKENIVLNCHAKDKIEAIMKMGEQLIKTNCISEEYIEGMLEREKNISTYIGNHIAIPHGEFGYSKYIKKSSLGIMVYPDGVDWGNGIAKVVIGIASKNDDHMEILANIAMIVSEQSEVDKIIESSEDYILDLFTKSFE